jgi:hypothetical protein
VSRIVPYFYHYIASGYIQYPDGKGLFYQPLKLIQAFEVLLFIYKREEKLKRKKDGEN